MKILLLTALASGIVLAQTAAPKAAPKAAPVKAAPAPPNLLVPGSLKDKAPETFRVKMTTTKGDVILQVNRGWAPMGADRFYNLVKYGFFTNASFFRVIPGFMAQFGMSARPDVSAVWETARISDDRVLESNKRGTITFATAGPNSRTTQLFINYQDNARLDGDGFTPFGRVIEGMEVVDKFFGGYGDGPPSGAGPDQGRLRAQGKAYLDQRFPNLDRIISATIMPAEMPAAADTKKQ